MVNPLQFNHLRQSKVRESPIAVGIGFVAMHLTDRLVEHGRFVIR